MDSQLKKGFLEALVLALIKDEPAYGYKLFDEVSNKIHIASSTLYPILKRLEGQNALITYQEEYLGRLRKYYKITDEGKKKYQEYRIMCQELKELIDVILEENK